jgi:hypothetical protein
MADKPVMHHYLEMELSTLGLMARLAATARCSAPSR